MPQVKITQDLLKERLHYNPVTGVFTHKQRDRDYFSSSQSFTLWNARYAGTVAGTIVYGYRNIRVGRGTPQKAHRLAFLYMTGEVPGGEVDHINGNRDDNRWCNLRSATKMRTANLSHVKELIASSINQRNRKINVNNTTGLPGVYWEGDTQKWFAKVSVVGGSRLFLGYYDNLLDAVAARKSAELKNSYCVNHGRAA